MTTAQVVETSVTVNNSPIQENIHLDDNTQPTLYLQVWNDSWVKTFYSFIHLQNT